MTNAMSPLKRLLGADQQPPDVSRVPAATVPGHKLSPLIPSYTYDQTCNLLL